MSSKTKRIEELEAAIETKNYVLRNLREREANRIEAEREATQAKRNAEMKAEWAARDAEREKVRSEKLRNIRNGLIPLDELRKLVGNVTTTADGAGSKTVTTITLRSGGFGYDDVQRAVVDALSGKPTPFSLGGYTGSFDLGFKPSTYGIFNQVFGQNGGIR